MKCFTAIVISILIGLPIMAQSPVINAGHFNKLSKNASEYTEINISGTVIKLALKAVKSQEPEIYENIKDLVKGIYVHALVFDKEGQYSQEDVEIIKRQIKMPPWERIVQVSSKNGEDVGVYILGDPKKDIIKGLIVLVAEKKELVLVNIVGNIDLDKLNKLGGNFGIPKIDYKNLGSNNPKEEKKEDLACKEILVPDLSFLYDLSLLNGVILDGPGDVVVYDDDDYYFNNPDELSKMFAKLKNQNYAVDIIAVQLFFGDYQ